MTKEETIKSIAKTIHGVEFPNSACWFGCNKCLYNGNCGYLKAAEIIYEQYVEQTKTETAKDIIKDIDLSLEDYAWGDIREQLKRIYKVED